MEEELRIRLGNVVVHIAMDDRRAALAHFGTEGGRDGRLGGLLLLFGGTRRSGSAALELV